MAPSISICIPTQDEQRKVLDALASARACPWCDELLVVDSGSTDRTVEIARRYADRVEYREWVDYATSKRVMTELARNDWVFILDADEQITPELAQEIAGLDEATLSNHPVVTMPRRNYLLGRYVRAWSPDRQTRLIDRRRVRWPDRAVHDARLPTEGRPLHLTAPLLHNAHTDDWRDYFDGPRYGRRTDAIAREMLRRGRRVGFLGLLLRPWAAFLKFYLLKRGFLDGTHGLLIAQKAAVSTQLKYARLWHLQQQEKVDAAEPEPNEASSADKPPDCPADPSHDPSAPGFRPNASDPKASESDPDRPGPPAA